MIAIIGICGIIGAFIYLYPWIQPLIKMRPKRRQYFEEVPLELIQQGRPKRRAPPPPAEKEMKRPTKAPPPPTISEELAKINQITAPSAPNETQIENFVHTWVPKIYQVDLNSVSQNGTQPYFTIETNRNQFRALLDTGASVSYCRMSVAMKIGDPDFNLGPFTQAKVANGNSFPFLAKITTNFRIKDIEIPMTILVSKDSHCPAEILMGTDFMKNLSAQGYDISFEWKNNTIKLIQTKGELQSSIPMIAIIEIETKNKVVSKEMLEIEPHSENLVPAKALNTADPNPIFISEADCRLPDCILIGKTLCNPENAYVRILNSGNAKMRIHQNQSIAKWEPIVREETVYEINLGQENIQETPELDITVKLPESFPQKDLLSNLKLEESCLSEGAKNELKRIIAEHENAFVGPDGNIGHFKGQIKHRIDLIDESKIVQQRPYRVPPQLRDEVHKQIHELLRQNIIRESDSVFASPIVLVKKRDGKYRFAIDYRQLNQNTKKSCYFLPLIQDILDEIGGKSIFSSFDFMSGFFQIGIEEAHIERTAFATFCGVYEFLRMPMGLCGAPCTFQKAMEFLRKEIGNGILCCLDDLIIASMDEASHLEDIRKLLSVLDKYNLKLRLDKCTFGRSEIKYLGFLISAQGMKPDPKNVAAVQRFDPPKTLHQLRSFIGCVSYFRRFIKNFATIMAPLHELTKTEESIEKVWGEQHAKAFEEIKNKLLTAPVLASPRFNKGFIIETDASKVAIAGCLLQKGEGGEHPISYVSRKLNPAEQRYTTAEMEALAIIYSVGQFRPYLEGNQTSIVRTDNTVACSLLKKRDLVGRMAKYQLALQEYNIKIEHRSGKSNTFCDYISRFPGNFTEIEANKLCAAVDIDWEKIRTELREKTTAEPTDFELPKQFFYPTGKVKVVTLEEIREELKKDKAYKDIIQILEKEEIPETVTEQEKFLLEVEKVHEKYSLTDGILYKWVEIGRQTHPVMVIPFLLRERITRECHEDEMLGAHLGIVKTIERMRKRFWWKNLIRDTKRHINACVKCQERKTHPKDVFKEPLNPIPIPNGPFERVHIDILGPLPITAEGFRYILTMTDAFSKWLVAMPMVTQTAENVSKSFVDNFLTKFGAPKYVVSDNGRQFVSKIFEGLAKIYCFKHNKTTTYRPQANGAVERLNKVVADMLFNYTNKKGTDWADFLQIVVFAYNTSIHASTGQTPFYIIFLRDPKMPIDLRLERENKSTNECEPDLSDYVEQYSKELLEISENVKNAIKKAQDRQKLAADRNRHAREHDFRIGELVMVLIDRWPTDELHKFRPRWSGPWRITEIKGPVLTVKNLGQTDKIVKINKEKAKKFIQNLGNTGPDPPE